MDIKIIIGREAEGSNSIRVQSKYEKVSRQHAFLYWHNGMATLEDNESTNGTYVNGSRITKAQINENDTVWLGGNGVDSRCYQLDLRKIFALCRQAESSQHVDYYPSASGANNRPSEAGNVPRNDYPRQALGASNPQQDDRTDYTKEFAHLKQVYIDYHEGLSKVKNKASRRMQLPRLLLSLIPAVIGLVFMLALGGSMGFVAISIGSVLSGVIGTLTMGKNNSHQEQMAEDIMDLQFKYQKEYKCPKCGKEYSLDLHWKKLQMDGKCPFGCGARFV